MKNNKIFRRNNPGTALSREAHLSLSPFSLLRSPGTAWYRRPIWASLSAYCLLLLCPVVALADDPDLLVCNSKGYILTSAVNATGNSITYEWYENGVKVDGADATLTINARRGGGVYAYVRKAFSAECQEGVTSNTFTVQVLEPAAPAISVDAAEICQDAGNLVFSITPAANTTYSWTKTAGTDGTPSGADNSTYTVSSALAVATTVKAAASVTYNIGALAPKVCVSDFSTDATATVNPLPVVSPKSTYAQCGIGPFTLGVNVSVTGSDITWYSKNDGSDEVGTGASYTTPSLTETTSYYVGAVTGKGCASNGYTTVTATVNLNEGAISGNELP